MCVFCVVVFCVYFGRSGFPFFLKPVVGCVILLWHTMDLPFEPFNEKTCIRGFRQGPTQAGLYNKRKWPEARNLRVRKKRDCAICVVKTMTLICAFVFADAKK